MQLELVKAPAAPPDPNRLVIEADAGLYLLERREAVEVGILPPFGLVVADPPWSYTRTQGTGDAADEYDCLTTAGIVDHLDLAYDVTPADAYLLVWSTWPTMREFITEMERSRWRYVTGAAWTKWGAPDHAGQIGIGYHGRGDSEPLLIFTKGKPRPRSTVRLAHVSPRTEHSEKPVDWLRDLVEAYSDPAALVLELYGGLATVARACKRLGRACVTVEIDPVRAEAGRALIAQERGE
jgi:N6-adenosine-specific RNA methylase IME4